MVNNTFENAVRMEDQHVGSGPYSGVWANNIGGGWACLYGVTYRNNVGKVCHSSDKAVSPKSRCGPPACQSMQTMPVGWVNPASVRLPPVGRLGGGGRRRPRRTRRRRTGGTDAERAAGRRRLRALKSA